jgi:tetratricopeptide (TPR) repeat protein
MLSLLEPLHPGVGLGIAQLERSRVLRAASDLDAANQLLNEAAATFRQAHSVWGQGQALLESAGVLLDLGFSQEAQAHLQRSFAHFKSTDPPLGLMATKLRYADLLTRTGELAKADQKLKSLLTALAESGFGPDLARCQLIRARNFGRQGESVKANDWFAKGIETARRVGDYDTLLTGLVEQGRHLAREGRDPEAFQALREALAMAREHQCTEFSGKLQCLLGDLSAARGRNDDASKWYSHARTNAASRGNLAGVLQVEASTLRSSCSEDSGRSPAHIAEQLEALQVAAEGFVFDEILWAQEALANAWSRQGDKPRAATLLGEVLNGYQKLGAHGEVTRLTIVRSSLGGAV